MSRKIEEKIGKPTLAQQAELLRHANEQLDMLREQFSDLYDYAPVGYATLDEAGVIHRINLPGAAMLGCARGKVIGTRFTTHLRTGSRTACATFIRDAFAGSGKPVCEVALQEGRWRAEHVQLIAAAASGGRDLGHAGPQLRIALVDVTERRKAEEALQASERRHEAVVSAMAEGVVVRGADGAVLFANTAAERILGLSSDEIFARKPGDFGSRLIREDGSPFPKDEFPATTVLRTGIPRWDVVMGIASPDEETRWVNVRTEPIRGADRKVAGAVSTFADVTAARAREAELGASREKLAHVLEGGADGFWDWDLSTGLVTFSARMSSILGGPDAEITGDPMSWSDRVDPAQREHLKSRLAAMAAGDVDRVDDENRVRMPDGAWKWLRTKGRVVARGADGKPSHFAGTVADVTEFKEFGERLRRSEAHFRELIRSLPIPLAFANDRGEIVDLNEAFTRMLGYDLGDIPTVAAWYERAYPDPAYRRSVTGPWDETVRKVATEGGPAPFTEARVTCKNGDVRTVLITGVPLGESLLVTLVDVTERRTAEKALARSEARYRGLFDTLMDGLCVVDMGGAIQEFNETYRQMLGWSADELRKMTYPQLTPETWHVAEARIVAEQILPRGYSEVYEKEYRRKDGSVFPVELRTFLLREGGKPSAMWAIVRDVTARKKAERALQESESRFRRLAEAAPVGIFHAGGNGEATFVNAAVLAITGLSAGEATPPASWEIIHPEDREWVSRAWTEAVAAGTDFTGEFRLKPRGGRVTWVRVVVTVTRDDSGAKAGFVGALVDITESREVQAQLAMNSRLASMGTLVQGVAHEVNNPLAAEISGQGLALEVIEDVRDRLAASDLPDKEELGRNLALAIEALEDAQLGGKRIARIVQDLATLASPDPRRTRVRLIDIVDDARRWLLPSGARAAIVTVEDRGAPDVLASPGQIEQVLVNLLTNAANATQEGRRGEIAIRVGPGEPGMARLEVVDQGTGIAPANLTRIFDPFFTTHPAGAGRGSGLGLAIGHNIVRAHGGRLTVTSEVGKGSTFRVELPVAPGES